MKLPLNYEDIAKILPHRYPFLLVDRITAIEKNVKATGYKNVTANEQFFQGHFPEYPIMPGVLIVEALAQAGGVLFFEGADKEKRGSLVYFMGMDKVKFRQPVVPGDQLILEVNILKQRAKTLKMSGIATVDDKRVAEAELLAMIGDKI